MSDRKIYEAESILNQYRKLGPNPTFADLAKRHKAILKSKRFRAAFPKYGKTWRGDPVLKQGKGGGSYASYTDNEIRLGRNQCEVTLYHEIVHHIVRFHRDKYGPERGHGPGFIRAWLDFTKVVLGAEAERALRYSCSSARLKVWDAAKNKAVHIRKVNNPEPGWLKFGPEPHAEEKARRRAIIEAARTGGEVNCEKCGGPTVMEIDRYRPWRGRTYRVTARIQCVDLDGCSHFEWQEKLPQDLQAREPKMPTRPQVA